MGGEESTERGAKLREVVLQQILWALGIAAMLASAVWGAAAYLQSLRTSADTSWQPSVQQLEQQLKDQRQLLDGQAALIAAHQQTLAKLVDFMEAQTRARRGVGEREAYRKQLCARGSLEPALCVSLPSDEEIEALRR